MRASKSGSAPTGDIGQHLSEIARQELDTLRATLDLRLAALETALESPGHAESLERLVLDLARVATEEAAAATRQAALHAEVQARKEIQSRAAAQLSAKEAFETERVRLQAEIEGERRASEDLRKTLDAAQKKLADLQVEKQSAMNAQREELEKALTQARRDKAAAVDQERSERTRLEAAVEQERVARADLQASFEREQQARAQLEATIDAERQARAQLEASGGAERQARAQSEATLEAERRARAEIEALLEVERQAGVQAGAALEAERQARVQDRQTLVQEREAREQERATYETAAVRLAESLATLQHELDHARSELQARAEAATRERDALATQRDSLVRERDGLTHERESLVRERETLVRERDAAAKARDAAARDLERAARDLDLARAGATKAGPHGEQLKAIEAERGKLSTALREAEGQLEEVMRERDIASAKLDAVREAHETAEREAQARYQQLQASAEQRIRDLELELLQKQFAAQAEDVDLGSDLSGNEHEIVAVADVPPDLETADTPTPDAPTAAPEPPPKPIFGPPRRASRLAFKDHVEVQIDGVAAALVDLSVTGAQVVSEAPLKPNRAVKLMLPHLERPIPCRGKVVWARLETHAGGRLHYRAGVLFTESNEAALEAFMAGYSADR